MFYFYSKRDLSNDALSFQSDHKKAFAEFEVILLSSKSETL